MDANELATVAIDAMPLEVLTEADKGQVWGVLQMALRTLEMQYGALLAEADGETAEAKKLWREALGELESAKAEVAAAKPYPVLEQTLLDMNRAQRERDAFAAELDATGKRLANAQRDIERLTLERDKLSQQCDAMATEFDAKQRELDELRTARDETITGLQAENARLHRSLEERMTAHIPGAVQVAKTEELHGMADAFAQNQRMKAYLVPPGTDEL